MNWLVNRLVNLRLFHGDLDLHLVRASMVIIFFGYQKWFDYEAQGLIPFFTHGPLIFWMYSVFGIKGSTYLLGVSEWLFGALLLGGRKRWRDEAIQCMTCETQSRLIERQRTFGIADSQNYVVEHCSLLHHCVPQWIASGGMFMPSARSVWTSSIPMKPRIWHRLRNAFSVERRSCVLNGRLLMGFYTLWNKRKRQAWRSLQS